MAAGGKGREGEKKKKGMSAKSYFRNKWMLYAMLAIPLVYYVMFHYVPMYGLTIAFKDYNIFAGIADSEWIGFETFKKIFQMKDFWRALRNTLYLNMLTLVLGFPAPIILALFLNEIRSGIYKKGIQTVMYLPHFLSWVIIGGMVSQIFSTETGLLNQILAGLGLERIPFLSDNGPWVVMYVFVSIWQSIGWGAIIYMSAISSVDQDIYEAARVDGCSRFKMMYKITLPCITTTIAIMLILQIGGMFSIGLEKPLMLMNSMVMESADVLSTFTYRIGIENAKYSNATVIGLFQSVVNFILVIAANMISNKLTDEGIW